MPVTGEKNQQIEELTTALIDMDQYLGRLESGCAELINHFHSDRAASLDKLSQVVEGMGYCSQLLQSAVILLAAGVAQQDSSVTSFQDSLSQLFADIDQAAASEDYSLLADLTEYELPSLIQNAQQLVQVFQQQCQERNG